jgi:putative transposase
MRKPYWGNYFFNPWILRNAMGLGEKKIRKYVKYQEEKERRAERETNKSLASFRGLFSLKSTAM